MLKVDEKMRKESILLLGIAFALLVTTIPAKAETQTDVYWDTSGSVSISVIADDDAETYFDTEGTHVFGEFHATDHNNNPYSYQVDTYDVWVQAEIKDGGYIWFGTKRTDSYEPMYGEAGQERGIYLETDDYGFVGWRDNTNYARYRGCQYGFQNNNQLQASGNYFMGIYLTDSDDDGMSVSLVGSGSGKITVMNSESWGSSWKFGKGCGCYTNAHAEAEGEGTFTAEAYGENYLQSDLGFELPHGGEYHLSINYADGFAISNFASEGH